MPDRRGSTAKRTAERALRQNQERMRLLADGTRDYGIFMLDVDGRIVTWTPGAQRLKGYSAAEAIGQHFSIFYSKAESASGHPERELELAAANGRYEEDAWRIRKDGTRFWANVVITALHGADGTLLGYGKVTRDITERKLAEQALQSSEERFRGAFDDAPNGVSLSGPEGHFLQVNKALSKLTGYSIEALLTMRSLDLAHPEDVAADTEALAALFRGEVGTSARDKRCLKADGESLWVSVHRVAVRGPEGNVTAVLSHTQDISGRRLYEQQLVELANHDPLTGLANRALFTRELQSHLDRCRRYGATGAVLMLDLDHFKRINDTFGHNVGDELIISMAAALRGRLRAADTIARLGGDEFAVLLPEGGREEAELVAVAILQAVPSEVTILNGVRPRTITTSIGIAVVDDQAVSTNELLAAADLAMYDAKELGRDQYSLYTDERHDIPRSKARMTWAQRIERALETDAFELWAQPILDLHTNETNSHELLLRMRDPQGEVVPPGTFLYIAERLGLITDIDHWVTTNAIDLLARLQQHRPGQRLEVNISGLSVGHAGLRDNIAKQIAATGVDPAGLIFEITETAAVERITAAREFAECLRDLGCRFALDDFGAGFGSFYYLKHLPFDYVKIDGEFIASCTSSLTDRLVIDSVVSICRGLGKQTVAEFVGDEATLAFLRSRHVDYAQGYHIGHPVPLAEAFPEIASPPLPRPVVLGASSRTSLGRSG